MGFNEASTIQTELIVWAKAQGWEHIRGIDLPRADNHEVVIEAWSVPALQSLNPELDEDQDNLELVVSQIRAATLSAQNDGLVKSNELLTTMLRGVYAFNQSVDGSSKRIPRDLIDFETPANNRLVVSDEVTIGPTGKARRFDVVYYVNGYPLVVIETKNPVNAKTTWLSAAKELHDVYETEYPNFFAPNLLVAATDGLEFKYGAVRQPYASWNVWGSTDDDPTLSGPARVKRSAQLLLHPVMVLNILKDFALFSHSTSASGKDMKILPRYPQVEAATAIHDKVLSGRPGGLIWHHQGSGKTFLTVFAAFKLLSDDAVGNPTVIILVDRKELVRQTRAVFETAGMPRLMAPDSMKELRNLLANDERGVIITTIHKFKDAGLLNSRDNIIVMVDEAHRTQEGALGKDLRTALPNAKFYGMTGTPVADKERNTFALFGDPEDPDFIMSRYEPIRSIIDETTVPVIVEARLVNFSLDKEKLDESFNDFADDEGLDEDAKTYLAKQASSIKTILLNPERIEAVCVDIVDHYVARLAPLGQKAQVVAYDRDLVVAYAAAIESVLKQRGYPYVVGVNMSVTNNKDEKPEFKKFLMSEAEEVAQKERFLDVNDPLAFLVVTAKLMTGFDAPIEGVLYLDKPLKAHTLFQTITRPNRPWINPKSKQKKTHGLVVDYVGLAKAIGDSLKDPNSDAKNAQVTDVDELAGKFAINMSALLTRFAGLDLKDSSFSTLEEAANRIGTGESRDQFIKQFLAIETIWEFLHPHPLLDLSTSQYRWLAKVYEITKPTGDANLLLWERLGQKTLDLVHENMTGVAVDASKSKSVKLDAAGIALIKGLAEQGELPDLDVDITDEEVTLEDVMNTIERRIKHRLEETGSSVYKSLAASIEKLRTQSIQNAGDSVKWLEKTLAIAQQVVEADRMEAEGTLEENAALFDPNIGALTQIVEQNKPADLSILIPDIVHGIDAIVLEVAFTGWAETSSGDREVKKQLRAVLKDYGLPFKGDLFDRAYEYVRENY